MAIRDEEYAILAFGMEWIVSQRLKEESRLTAPRVYEIDGQPSLGEGANALVYWWHEVVDRFLALHNEARIDLLKMGGERGQFERQRFRDLGLEIESLDHGRIPRVEKWRFALSRVGLDREHRQAICHIWATPECDERHAFGTILVVGWEDDSGSLRVVESVETAKMPDEGGESRST